jgi:Arc/MetJ family transcription regulator
VATLGHFGPSDTFDAEDYVGTYSDLMNMPSVARNGGEKMRTTLNLPDNLMEEALRITRFRSKKDVVIHSLRELIRKKRLEELKDMKGKIDLEIDLNRSRRRKAVAGGRRHFRLGGILQGKRTERGGRPGQTHR